MGHKSSKNSTINCKPLDRETIDELCLDTGFTEEELLNWHVNFYKDCPDGKLTLKQFEQAYAKVMGKPTQKTADYIRHMFSVYDQDKNQFIDFKEFVMALSAASVVNRLRLVETLFHVFDLDNDGKITKDEIGKMLHTLVDVTNSNQKRRNQRHHHQQQPSQDNKQIDLQNRIDDAFNELNANDDDHITKDEFIEWYMKSGLISDVQRNEIDVSDSSRLQEISRKSRKLMKQTSHNRIDHEQDDIHNRNPSANRYISKMIERKPVSRFQGVDDDDDDDNNNGDDNDDEHFNRKLTTMPTSNTNKPKKRLVINTDDNDSHTSKENERWQYLFNSVLGQIRSQHPREQRSQIQENQQNNFSSWKNEGEEKAKVEYFKQKSTGQFSAHNNRIQPTTTSVIYEPSSNPDIVTVRL